MKHLGKLDLVVSFGTLLLAFWQMLLIDQTMAGFIIAWTFPPVLAVAVRHFNSKLSWPSIWASAYLILLGTVQWAASDPTIAPEFVALHPAATEFAVTWNQLDVVTRRVICANMALSGAFLFALLGYQLGWRPIVHPSPHAQTSRGTCALALITFWLLPGLSVIVVIVESLRR